MGFSDVYNPDNAAARGDSPIMSQMEKGSPGFGFFMARYSGVSFEGGLYRVHPIGELDKWTSMCLEEFPEMGGRILSFASDWLGRQFALDSSRFEDGERLVLMLEPGTGEALEIPTGFRDFHDSELVAYKEASLAASGFQQWLAGGGRAPANTECVGYRVPLFMGGADDVANMEICDMEVYWSTCAQLLSKIRRLPAGTRIHRVEIDEQ